MAATTDTPEKTPEKVIVSGIDLTEYYLASQSSYTRYTPMGRFLEGPGIGRMDALIVPSSPPSNTAGRKIKTMKNRKKGSMAAELPVSEGQFFCEN